MLLSISALVMPRTNGPLDAPVLRSGQDPASGDRGHRLAGSGRRLRRSQSQLVTRISLGGGRTLGAEGRGELHLGLRARRGVAGVRVPHPGDIEQPGAAALHGLSRATFHRWPEAQVK
ncbi:hypothetical protein BYZ73_06675 [Rhodovulum viride]|uniref:Uncharacterized protein n=1 Tax=Rhodovulum viride TaxID=1231134 RepID=A0ABX9DKE1_9RHOB|nr:hypothetical protein BYZ73_06675 [Rhodovulum viride]